MVALLLSGFMMLMIGVWLPRRWTKTLSLALVEKSEPSHAINLQLEPVDSLLRSICAPLLYLEYQPHPRVVSQCLAHRSWTGSTFIEAGLLAGVHAGRVRKEYRLNFKASDKG